MKKIFLLMGFCCTVSLVNAQTTPNTERGFQDVHHNTLGTIRNGSVYDKNDKLMVQFVNEEHAFTVKNGQNQAIGYILRNEEFQDASHKTIGYARVDRSTYVLTIEDASHNVIGYVKPGGIVENSSHTVVGYDVKTEPLWGAAYFLVMKF